MNRVASVIKLDYARKQGLTGKNVGIAVMDTGISPHPDIVYNDGPFVSFFDTINHQNRLYDDNGHGTHVADRKSTRLNSSHKHRSRMPSSA